MLNDNQKKQLLQLARNSIKKRLLNEAYQTPEDPAFDAECGAFVTLHLDGRLRGCIGYVQAFKSIRDTIRQMALAAAFEDPRFPPLQRQELPHIRIEISLLSPLILVQDLNEITIGRDGLLLKHPYSSGLLLPQVATQWGWDRDTFLKEVSRKAGLHSSAYRDAGAKLYRFSAEVFGENE
ncbi:MAG: AmmeMemoRadiSam system protein A [Candidatus Cloacimonetes bacterium]|nr:AmmeMemoRadiSam system protein A [Candidatus Cloacimonadota bacterium]